MHFERDVLIGMVSMLNKFVDEMLTNNISKKRYIFFMMFLLRCVIFSL
jgi:hypothetical protein